MLESMTTVEIIGVIVFIEFLLCLLVGWDLRRQHDNETSESKAASE
jgi:hypothetical protein